MKTNSYLQLQRIVGTAFEDIQNFHVYLQCVIARWISKRQFRVCIIVKTVIKKNQLPFVIFIVKLIAKWHVRIFPAVTPNVEFSYQCITSCRRTKAGSSFWGFICKEHTLCLSVNPLLSATVQTNEVLTGPVKDVFGKRENRACGVFNLS